jgi:hypothetical protein
MDLLLTAAAEALGRRTTVVVHPVQTPADEDAYYAQHTLNIIVPAWVPAVSALFRKLGAAPGRFGAIRHAWQTGI